MNIRTLLVTGILTFSFPENNFSSGRFDDDKGVPSVRIGLPVRIHPSNITQTETFITRHPNDPNILFASANTINPANGFISEGTYVSANAGTTWTGSDTNNGPPITFHRGDPGIAIDKNGVFLLVRLGFSPGLYSHYSTNNGLTWSAQKTISTNDQDRASLTSDVNPTSGFYGRSYTTWVRFAPPYPIFLSYTDDGAANWTAPAQINSPSQRSQGAEVTMGPSGRINLCWAGVINTSPFTEDFVGFATSTNGGANWTITENAYDANGIQGTFPQKGNIRVNGLPKIATDLSGGARHGWIYIVTTEKNLAPAGSDPDIIFHRSTNNGATWSGGIRVNTDALNNGKMQYFPAIHVDNSGGINVLYYDDRNTTSDSATVYLARSVDGGNSWTDVRVGSNTFKPQAIGGLGQGYQGDNIGMTSLGNTLWPVWMDNSTGIYQIWTCPIDIATIGQTVNVYSGDANNDGVSDIRDILPIGRFFGSTGPARTGGSLAWGPQTAAIWSPTEATYADCDGNGTVNASDVQGIINNYSLTHTSAPDTPVDRIAACNALLRQIDGEPTLSGPMKEIRNEIISYMKQTLGITFNYFLAQNYPNPFNPITKIGFAIENSATVSLKVYDIQGKEIATLVDMELEAGSYESTFEAKGLSSGIYFYRLRAGEFQQTRKLVLMR